MKLEFESIEEVKEFVTKLKGTRGGKADKEDEAPQGQAPAPMAPPAGGQFTPGAGFAPPAAGATAGGAGPFAAAANGPAPEVLALVTRINTRIDGAAASGQPVDQMVAWFRGECAKAGLDANNATMDQIKAVFLPKMPVPALEGIAKLMNA
jgi:hypothetical protein